MRIILLTLVLLPAALTTFAQHREPGKTYDFSSVDPQKISKETIYKEMDSIRMASGYDSLMELASYIRSRESTQDYVAFVIGYHSQQASLDNFQDGLRSSGFTTISETFGGVPVALEVRGGRFLFTYLATIGIKNRASNSEYTLDVKGFNAHLGVGYDILNTKRFQFYPQLALGIQGFDIDLKKKSAASDIKNINELLSNPSGTALSRNSFNLTYGLELDYHLLYSPNGVGIILGAQYARTATIAEGNFRINGNRSAFESNDRMNQSFFAVVLKFYGRS